MVYLITILSLYTKPEFINIINIQAKDVYIFWAASNRLNIMYSVVEYKEEEFRIGDITAVYRLVEEKLEEYPASAKIIIYSSSIVTT